MVMLACLMGSWENGWYGWGFLHLKRCPGGNFLVVFDINLDVTLCSLLAGGVFRCPSSLSCLVTITNEQYSTCTMMTHSLRSSPLSLSMSLNVLSRQLARVHWPSRLTHTDVTGSNRGLTPWVTAYRIPNTHNFKFRSSTGIWVLSQMSKYLLRVKKLNCLYWGFKVLPVNRNPL